MRRGDVPDVRTPVEKASARAAERNLRSLSINERVRATGVGARAERVAAAPGAAAAGRAAHAAVWAGAPGESVAGAVRSGRDARRRRGAGAAAARLLRAARALRSAGGR